MQELLERQLSKPNTRLSTREIPLIIVTTGSKEVHMINHSYARALEEAGKLVEVLAQP